jgi:uncharacterized protein YbaR (Trm112 family)
MVIVDCPMCLGPVALADDADELSCDDCSIHVEIADGIQAVAAKAA